jgi:uncharacterized repeat protein (TIGR01451 family)
VDIVHQPGTLSITKSADVAWVYHGDTITYTFNVTYSSPDGSSALNVSVSDPQCDAPGPAYVSGDTDVDGELDVSETWVYECTDPILNVATADADDAEGDPLPQAQSNQESVDIVHQPGTLTIEKSGPASAEHDELITFEYDVTYSSSDGAPAQNVVVTDNLCSPVTEVDENSDGFNDGDTDSDGLLDVGETWLYECEYTVPAHSDTETNDPFTNTGTVNGEDADGDALEPDTSSHETDIDHDEGTLTIVKSGPAHAVEGQDRCHR